MLANYYKMLRDYAMCDLFPS